MLYSGIVPRMRERPLNVAIAIEMKKSTQKNRIGTNLTTSTRPLVITTFVQCEKYESMDHLSLNHPPSYSKSSSSLM